MRLLENLTAEMHRTAQDPTVDAVHDLRVATRRATAALRHHKQIRKQLKAIRQRAAAVRDRDVTLALLRRHRLSASDPAMAYLQGQRDLAAQQLRDYLKTCEPPAVEHAIHPDPPKLEPIIEAFFSAGATAASTGEIEQLHTFRIAAKKLRYSLELHDAHAPQLGKLKLVQRQLGGMNDAIVAAKFLQGLPRLSPRARKLPALLQALADKHIAAFQRTWRSRFGQRAESQCLRWASQADR